MLMNPLIFGAEIASQGEGDKIIEIKSSLKETIFTGPAKTEKELEFAIKNNIKTVNVESLVEAHRIDKICEKIGKKQDILLRINANIELHGSGKMSLVDQPSAFGIPEDFAETAILEIDKLKNIRLMGFHTYSATGVLEYSELIKSVEYSFNLCKNLEEKFKRKFSILDFGGGFGIDYFSEQKFDIVSYSNELKELIKKYSFEDKTLFLELGRYLCAEMGFFVTKIVDIKKSKGAMILTCAGGINSHRRPSLFGGYKNEIFSKNKQSIYEGQPEVKENDTVLICGPLCTSADTLTKGVIKMNQKARIGDYLVQNKAGAYGKSMSITKFLSHPETEEILFE
jgi:diaminopimelate decarboxylase